MSNGVVKGVSRRAAGAAQGRFVGWGSLQLVVLFGCCCLRGFWDFSVAQPGQ